MKLSIPFTAFGQTWIEVEYGRPTTETMADAQVVVESGDYFSTMLVFLAGIIKSLTSASGKTETDKGQIKNIVREFPAGDADHVSLFALGQGQNDAIEGFYVCPRCGKTIVCDGDQMDSIKDLEIIECDPDPMIQQALSDPVIIKDRRTGDELMRIDEVTLRHPSVRDYIQAFTVAGKDRIRQQAAAYANALIKVNGRPVDDEFKRQYGAWAMGKAPVDDLNSIAEKIMAVGLQRKLEKRCSQCGKVWKATVSTSGFFVSALGGQ
jgi:DNA-directed RNA polymerase subunit RPC12/RpoP